MPHISEDDRLGDSRLFRRLFVNDDAARARVEHQHHRLRSIKRHAQRGARLPLRPLHDALDLQLAGAISRNQLRLFLRLRFAEKFDGIADRPHLSRVRTGAGIQILLEQCHPLIVFLHHTGISPHNLRIFGIQLPGFLEAVLHALPPERRAVNPSRPEVSARIVWIESQTRQIETVGVVQIRHTEERIAGEHANRHVAGVGLMGLHGNPVGFVIIVFVEQRTNQFSLRLYVVNIGGRGLRAKQ